MKDENEIFIGLLESHLSPMIERLRAIPPDRWDWTPGDAAPSPRVIAEHTLHWLVSDRMHIQEPDITRHALISDIPSEQQALCESLSHENRIWRAMIMALTPEHLAERRFQFGIWPRNVRYMVAHVTQQVIYKHGQLSSLFFLLGLDGEEPYQAPFPNDDYSRLQKTMQHPLHSAVLKDDAISVRRELAKGYDLALPTATGYTLLRLAVLHDCADVVHLLLEAGADGNETDSDGNTPLIAACFTESTAAVRALIMHGVDLHKTNRWNGDALGFARMKDNPEMVALLQQAEAGEDAQSPEEMMLAVDAAAGPGPEGPVY